MCGIAGVLYKQAGTHEIGKTLIDMLDGCQHRGPDSTGFALYGEDKDYPAFEQWLGTAQNSFERADVGPDDVMSQMYTSGTTGLPKGVLLSHRNIISNVSKNC